MKDYIKYIQPHTFAFLQNNISLLANPNEINELISDICGIDNFFKDQNESLNLLDNLKSSQIVREESDKIEYGDFQTPYTLTNSICSHLLRGKACPEIIIEPTFGKGSFIISALNHFQNVSEIYGIEIFEPYYWWTKFSILEMFINNPNLRKAKILLYLDDIFKFDLGIIGSSIKDRKILILGNPPWVTNSKLGGLNSNNLPQKSNFKSLNGLEAITGKSNFDIAEYIIMLMLNYFSKYEGSMAILLKNSVIRNLIYDLPKMNYNIDNISALEIDTKGFFGASVNASLLEFKLKSLEPSFTCKVSGFDLPNSSDKYFGWSNGKFASDIVLYRKIYKYDGICPYIWRQGVKHDCSKIMEVEFINGKYKNGLEIEVDLEEDPIYGLVKSSDLNSLIISKTRKHVIITQKTIGENTFYLLNRFPKLHQYLLDSSRFFEMRKSGVYKNMPPFSIFGIGDYSFKLYKVAISGLYKRSKFSLILSESSKPLMLDDTCYFIGFDRISDAIFAWAILNSNPVQQLLGSIVFLDSKRPYTKDILMRIGVDIIAKEFTYKDIANYIQALDERMLSYVNHNLWDTFLEEIIDKNAEKEQLSLFSTKC